MQKRTLKVAILAALTIVLVFSMSAAAFAQPSQYSDLNGATVGPYKVTLEEVSAISDVAAGKFRPFDNITRAEFAVMAVKAFDIPLVSPATPSFPDVPATHALYQYIEAAAKAGIIQGYTDGKFGPKDTATRQQMLSIIARYVGGKAGYYANGVWNFRTAAEIDALVAHFGDAAAIDPAHKTAMAFAYAMGITLGDAKGNLAPLTNLTRIQGAAMLIRSQALVPFSAAYPTTVVQVTADKSENLIGQTHTVKFKVTDAAGHPAKGALVDFDTMYASPFYVGNISPQAAVADAFGEVTVNLLSAEPGTQRVTATVQTITGPATAMATKYWLALDEVYITNSRLTAENNAGESHTWGARVVVVGPGPRSTSAQDWYNSVSTDAFDASDIQATDGVDATDYYLDYWSDYDVNEEAWDYDFEKWLLSMYDLAPRTLAGIDVDWSLIDYKVVDTDDVDIAPSKYILDEDLWWYDYNADAYADDYSANFGPIAGGNYVYLYNPDDSYGDFSTVKSVKFGTKAAPFSQDTNNGRGILVRVPKVSLAKTVTVTVVDADGTHVIGLYQYVDTVTTVASVGNITAVDGTALATPAATATGKTDAAGYSSVTIQSNATGQTWVQAIADYDGNPYPEQLFAHDTFQYGYHSYNWFDQPTDYQVAQKIWIPHVIGDNDAPIVAASYTDNTGEVEKFTLTLKDSYGNLIPGYTVQWWIQGVGQFKGDGTSWSGIGEQNKEVDITNAAGQSVVYVTSEDPGQTILHCKVMDKYGLPYHEWNVVKQWYAIDNVSILPTLDPDGEVIPAVNLVGTSHTFTAQVSGWKYVFTIYDVNQNGLSDDQVLIGDRADLKAAYGAVLDFEGEVDYLKKAGEDLPVGRVFVPGITDAGEYDGYDYDNYWYITRFADIALTGAESWSMPYAGSAWAYYDDNDDDVWIDLVVSGLAGKNVWFFNNIGDMYYEGDSNEGPGWYVDGLNKKANKVSSIGGYPAYVGSITAPTTLPVVSDAKGQATVTINSNDKGWQFVFAVADYKDNPQYGDPTDPTNWDELNWDFAVKKWVVSGGDVDADIVTFNNAGVEGVSFMNPVYEWAGYELDDNAQANSEIVGEGELNPNYDVIGVSVFDQYGNALPGYRVQFEIIDQGKTDKTGSDWTYRPFTHFSNAEQGDEDSYIDDAGIDTVEDLEDVDDLYDWGHSRADAEDEYGDDLAGQDGIFDRGRYVDANPIWDSAEDEDDYGMYDDDKAIGYTMNGAIDGVADYANAAYAVLVLDETYDDLLDSNGDEYVTRINVQVWSPSGTLVDEYKIDKEWSIEEPDLDSLSLLMSEEDDYSGLATSLTTDVDPVYVQVNALDQFGDLITGLTGDVVVKVTMGSSYTTYLTLTEVDDGIWQGEFVPENGTGTYKLTPFVDDDPADLTYDSGEFKGATRSLIWED